MANDKKPSGLTAIPNSPVVALDDEDVQKYNALIQEAIARGDVQTVSRLGGVWADSQVNWAADAEAVPSGFFSLNPLDAFNGDANYLDRGVDSKDKQTLEAAYQNKIFLENAKVQAEANYVQQTGRPYIANNAQETTLTPEQIEQLANGEKKKNYAQQFKDFEDTQTANFNANITTGWKEDPNQPGSYYLTGYENQKFTFEEAESINKEWAEKTQLIPLANGKAKKLIQNEEGNWVEEETGEDWTDQVSFAPIVTDDKGNPVPTSTEKANSLVDEQTNLLGANGLDANGNPVGGGTSATEDDPEVFIGNDPEIWAILQRVLDAEGKGLEEDALEQQEQKTVVDTSVANNINSGLGQAIGEETVPADAAQTTETTTNDSTRRSGGGSF